MIARAVRTEIQAAMNLLLACPGYALEVIAIGWMHRCSTSLLSNHWIASIDRDSVGPEAIESGR
jgi:hypothetical protein